MKWTIFQDDSQHRWSLIAKDKTTKETKRIVTDYVNNGFKFSIEKQYVPFLGLDKDILLCGSVVTDPKISTMYRDDIKKDAQPIVWLLSDFQGQPEFLPGKILNFSEHPLE
jgi:hypothetical protein